MEKKMAKVINKLVNKTLKINVNSTTSVCAYQPKVPSEVKKLSK